MGLLLAITAGVVFAAALYMMRRRSIVKLVIGIALLGHAVNLLVFTSGHVTRDRAPIIREGAARPEGAVADPVPQALVLTAIVIGLGVLAFTLVLVHRVHKTTGADDLDELRSTDT